jgi:undecaprenyl-diphosphatase
MKALTAYLRNTDLVLLFGPLLVVACLWVFLSLAEAVEEGTTHELDVGIVRALRQADDPSQMIGPTWFEEAVRDATALGGTFVLVLVTALVAGFLAIEKRYHIMWFVLISTLGGLAASSALKEFFDRPRPDVVPHLSHVHTSSFPSGHSMLAAVVYLTLASLLVRLVDQKRLKVYILGSALLITVLVGVSRVFVGVHYPTDVLAGWSAGLCWATLCSVVARWLQQRHVLETCLTPEGEQP